MPEPYDCINGVRFDDHHRSLFVTVAGLYRWIDWVRVPPVDSVRSSVERQAWLSRVRDKLNAESILVSACDLSIRSCLEISEAERWVDRVGPTQAAPRWLRPFFREPGETILQTRYRARAELRACGAV